MTEEVVDVVTNAVVDNEVHVERLLEEEVALIIDLLLVIHGPVVQHIETACDVTLPLARTANPLHLSKFIDQGSASASTHFLLGPCARGDHHGHLC